MGKKNKINNLQKRANEIEELNMKLALGYESTIDFNYGYILALFKNKLITKKEQTDLIRVYSSIDNENCLFSIENGKFVSYEDSDDDIDPEDLH